MISPRLLHWLRTTYLRYRSRIVRGQHIGRRSCSFNRPPPQRVMIADAALVPAHLLFQLVEGLGKGGIAIGGAPFRGRGKSGRQMNPGIAAEIIRIAREGRRDRHGAIEIFLRIGGEMLADMFGQRGADLDLLALDLDMHWTSPTY